MRWSKVRKLVEDSFADSVKGRVTVHCTKYPGARTTMKTRGWIAIDGAHVANFDDYLMQTLHGVWLADVTRSGNSSRAGALHNGGYFGRAFTQSCFDYVHSSVATSLVSPNPVIRALAMVNAKVGRQRLAKYFEVETHPLPKALAQFRIAAESEARSRTRTKALEPSP